MPYLAFDFQKQRIKHAAITTIPSLPHHTLTMYTFHLSDNGGPEYSKRVSPCARCFRSLSAVSKPYPSPQKRLLHYIRLPAAEDQYILRFKITAGSLASNKGVLYTNYPIDGFSGDFSRDDFCDLIISQSGAYEYYVEYELAPDPSAIATIDISTPGTERSNSGYFVIEPRLRIKRPERILPAKGADAAVLGGPAAADGKIFLPIDGLVIESIVAKWMGPVTGWGQYLRGVADAGYNMVHFVPIQKRGGSNSPYSIFDQLGFADDLFDKADVDKSAA
ncbi:glucanotransferase domain of glycogen debranching enzyme-domain-containing protein, partial [Endogone sp. FLAS-F59071]